jgi:hypothetical protein
MLTWAANFTADYDPIARKLKLVFVHGDDETAAIEAAAHEQVRERYLARVRERFQADGGIAEFNDCTRQLDEAREQVGTLERQLARFRLDEADLHANRDLNGVELAGRLAELVRRREDAGNSLANLRAGLGLMEQRASRAHQALADRMRLHQRGAMDDVRRLAENDLAKSGEAIDALKSHLDPIVHALAATQVAKADPAWNAELDALLPESPRVSADTRLALADAAQRQRRIEAQNPNSPIHLDAFRRTLEGSIKFNQEERERRQAEQAERAKKQAETATAPLQLVREVPRD